MTDRNEDDLAYILKDLNWKALAERKMRRKGFSRTKVILMRPRAGQPSLFTPQVKATLRCRRQRWTA